MIVGLAGYAGAGKDTAAQCLVERGWRQDSFAAPLKQMAYDINPWIPSWHTEGQRLRDMVDDRGWEDAKKVPAVRQFLQNLGSVAEGPTSKASPSFDRSNKPGGRAMINTLSDLTVKECEGVLEVYDLNGKLCAQVGPLETKPGFSYAWSYKTSKSNKHAIGKEVKDNAEGLVFLFDHLLEAFLDIKYTRRPWPVFKAEPVEFGDFILCPACKPRRRTMRWDR